MKAHTASLLNAIILIIMAGWGYLSSDTPSVTALIPLFIGVILLVLNKGLKNENKVVAHIAVLLTVLILSGLVKPLMGAMDRSDTMALFRVGIMLISTIVALVFFVRSFREARKNRSA